LDCYGAERYEAEQAVEGKKPNFKEDIICSRTFPGNKTNVPHKFVLHSPTGFDWGYGGSGPADFALNILAVFEGKEFAYRYHQDFQWEFISNLPYEGGTIKHEAIIDWITSKKLQKEVAA
jgi:hypothetical protein